MNENNYKHYRDPDHEFSNQADYPLMRERLDELVRSDPYSRYQAHAVGIGEKITGGQLMNYLAIRVYVSRKTPFEEMPPERRVPPVFHIYSHERGEEVALISDVIEESPPVLLDTPDPNDVIRPVPGGASCKAWRKGTIGGWVWDKSDDTIVMLSNQHVFGNIPGIPIIQPHDGNLSDRIGEVKRSVPLYPQGQYPDWWCVNVVDAAVGEADSSDFMDLSVLEIGPAVYDIMEPHIGFLVEKFGKTTGHTLGVIVDHDYHFAVYAPIAEPNVWAWVAYCVCFKIVPWADTSFAESGDSGSIIFYVGPDNQPKPALGLLFAASESTAPDNNWGAACRMSKVFSSLDLGPLFEFIFVWVDLLPALEDPDDPDSLQSPTPDISPPVVTGKERGRQRSRNFHSGLAADLGRRLKTSKEGRRILDFLKRYEDQLLTLAVKDGDTRRSLVASLRPLFAGAITTNDVLLRELTAKKIDQLNKLIDLLANKGDGELARSLKKLRALLKEAEGRSLAEILRINP